MVRRMHGDSRTGETGPRHYPRIPRLALLGPLPQPRALVELGSLRGLSQDSLNFWYNKGELELEE